MKERLIKRFQDEIAVLERELKVELPREILRARELGDLKENAEYHAAKERQRLVETRISMLSGRVAEIQLMNLDKTLSFLGGVVLSVLLQIAELARPQDLARQLHFQLALEDSDLILKTLDQPLLHRWRF